MLHILIPGQVYDLLNKEDFSWINNDFCKQINPYFENLKTNIVRKNNISSFELYFMKKQKSSQSDSVVTNSILKIVKKKFGEKVGGNPIIRFNYSRLNPKFNPVSDDKEILKPNQIKEEKNSMDEFDYDRLSLNYQAEEPNYSFDQVVLPQLVKERIEEAISIIEVESKVFDEWGLRSIIPIAGSAISFYGPPGTGKTMAAEAIAHKLGKKILKATYADIESKYHGEGPKMVKAIFRAAEREDAILFLDESDSLLSKRLTNVSEGSGQAINSMRSQLLICLEQFKGIVIFATNLVVNYDKAFVSRLINIEFTFPTAVEREKIWWNHLKTKHIRIPLGQDVDVNYLAQKYDFCGREIKNTVKRACIAVAMKKRDTVCQVDFVSACEKTLLEREQIRSANDHTCIN